MAFEQLADLSSVLDEDCEMLRKSCLDACVIDHVEECSVRVFRFAAALEDDAVAALYTERRDLHQRIRSRFEDDADHADRACHLCQHEIIVEFALQQLSEKRIFQVDEVVYACHARGKLVVVELQPVYDRVGKGAFLCSCEVSLICFEDLGLVCRQRLCDRLQRAVSRIFAERRHRKTVTFYLFDTVDKIHVIFPFINS